MIYAIEIPPGLLALGVILGMTYGVLAVGLVLVYRSNRLVNFAHGEIGGFGAAVAGVLIVRFDLPYWLGALAGILASAAIGSGTEVLVVRRLRRAPRIMSLVATLGVAQFLLFASAAVNGQVAAGSAFPQPAGMPEFELGLLRVTRAYSAMLFLTPLLVGGLVVFLRTSKIGLRMRASASNEERARLLGVYATRMSTLAWAIAGGVAAYTAILIIPTRGFITAEFLGPTLLLRALVPAVIARMNNLSIALASGLVVGLIEQILIFNYPTSGVPEVALFGIVLVALLFQTRGESRRRERESWTAIEPFPRLPEAIAGLRSVQVLPKATAGIAATIAVLVGLFVSNTSAVSLVFIVAFGLIGLSVSIMTGLGGQLSLGQFALAGVGAVASYHVVDSTGNTLLGLVAACVASALVSLVVGLPALRIQGMMLGVVTLAFALMAGRWMFVQSWALGDGVSPNRPVFQTLEITTTRQYYWYGLSVLAIGMWFARNIWVGGIGRKLRAVRDNEDGIRAFGVSATLVRLQGFAAAGVLAGLGGAVYGQLLSRISAGTFPVAAGIRLVALAALGGVGVLAGPLLGALYIIGVPRFVPLDSAGLATTELGWLLLILYFPGGIAQALAWPREQVLRWLSGREGVDYDAAIAQGDEDTGMISAPELRRVAPAPSHNGTTVPALAADNIVKRYGGVAAVKGVTLSLNRGEILGLIGTNGAGKTTLFEVLGGFSAGDEGTISLHGRDITRIPPERRAQLGLVRSFQDAALFPTLTVTETLALAFERVNPTRLGWSAVGVRASEEENMARARDLAGVMGLDRYRNKAIRELSTGTRRVAELACIVALEPSVVLLDEPSSGIAQRESEALGEMLRNMRDYLDCSMIVIEHDIPLIMGLSDRLIAMDTGTVIAEGSPADVRANLQVIRSYLGSDAVAIERSGAEV